MRSVLFGTISLFIFIYGANGNCMSGFKNIKGSCYKIIRVIGNYHQAGAKCRQLGSGVDLATIRCKPENDGIRDMYWGDQSLINQREHDRKTLPSLGCHTHQLWMGLHGLQKMSKSGTWYHDPHSSYRNWAPGEPNGYMGLAESGGEFILDDCGGNASGQWNDGGMGTIFWGAVCEQIRPTSGQGCPGFYRPPPTLPPTLPPPLAPKLACSIC